MQRLNTLATQVASTQKDDNDIVIVYSKRTPLTKSKKGPLKDTSCEMMLLPLLTDVKKTIDPKLIDDVIVGNVL